MENIIHHEIAEVSMKCGMKKWGKRLEDELSNYINQFYMRET